MIERTIEGRQCWVFDTKNASAITLRDIFSFAFKNGITLEMRRLQETGVYSLVRLRLDGCSSEACIGCSDIDDDSIVDSFNKETAKAMNHLLERLIHEVKCKKET